MASGVVDVCLIPEVRRGRWPQGQRLGWASSRAAQQQRAHGTTLTRMRVPLNASTPPPSCPRPPRSSLRWTSSWCTWRRCWSARATASCASRRARARCAAAGAGARAGPRPPPGLPACQAPRGRPLPLQRPTPPHLRTCLRRTATSRRTPAATRCSRWGRGQLRRQLAGQAGWGGLSEPLLPLTMRPLTPPPGHRHVPARRVQGPLQGQGRHQVHRPILPHPVRGGGSFPASKPRARTALLLLAPRTPRARGCPPPPRARGCPPPPRALPSPRSSIPTTSNDRIYCKVGRGFGGGGCCRCAWTAEADRPLTAFVAAAPQL
jgi:hypothetical protein